MPQPIYGPLSEHPNARTYTGEEFAEMTDRSIQIPTWYQSDRSSIATHNYFKPLRLYDPILGGEETAELLDSATSICAPTAGLSTAEGAAVPKPKNKRKKKKAASANTTAASTHAATAQAADIDTAYELSTAGQTSHALQSDDLLSKLSALTAPFYPRVKEAKKDILKLEGMSRLKDSEILERTKSICDPLIEEMSPILKKGWEVQQFTAPTDNEECWANTDTQIVQPVSDGLKGHKDGNHSGCMIEELSRFEDNWLWLKRRSAGRATWDKAGLEMFLKLSKLDSVRGEINTILDAVDDLCSSDMSDWVETDAQLSRYLTRLQELDDPMRQAWEGVQNLRVKQSDLRSDGSVVTAACKARDEDSTIRECQGATCKGNPGSRWPSVCPYTARYIVDTSVNEGLRAHRTTSHLTAYFHELENLKAEEAEKM